MAMDTMEVETMGMEVDATWAVGDMVVDQLLENRSRADPENSSEATWTIFGCPTSLCLPVGVFATQGLAQAGATIGCVASGCSHLVATIQVLWRHAYRV